jgi:aspartyl-tRNA(Asn)/glutamyl-tRNA(Gln) amidotransferase subunit C
MAIDLQIVDRIATLARLKIPDEQKAQMVKELNGILDWVAQLQSVDVTGIEPLASVNDRTLREREDVITDGGYPEKVLANAPAKTADFFVVPKVIE